METDNLQAPVILIVDDNPENLQVLGKLLKEEKYEVEFAVDGESALGWISNKQFDLLLLDINMTGMTGFEVCKTIRSDPKMNKLPIIFLSAESDRESILKGFELGGQDYITKPFDSRELIVRAKTHITLKHSLEKLETLNRYLEEKVQERTHQLREANEKLEATNLKLIALDKAKTEFLNLVSHEIRTPLNGIMGPLQLLKGPVDPNEIAELVDMLDSSVSRLEKFALNALLITKLKTKKDVSKNKIELANLIKEVINEVQDKLKAKNLKILKTIQSDQISISGEKNLIKTCLINILDNAIRYSPADAPIEVRCYMEDKYIICEVRDHGNGFSQEVIEQPFDLFITDNKYADNQIGLELPIVKMVMDAHGGKAKLSNSPEGGAIVRLEFIKTDKQ
jgi:two-component system sensor histidine kinase/response regulator